MSLRSLGEPLPGPGNLYPWGEGKIIKLYGEGTPDGWVQKLNRVERALYEAGLPVPEVGEIIEIDGFLGQIYERIEGGTMADDLLVIDIKTDRIVELAEIFAELHLKIHATKPFESELPSYQFLATVIRRGIGLSPEIMDTILNRLEEMPKWDGLCHGDFHPFNILMSPRGPIAIDWNNAHIGDPLEDVARTHLIIDEEAFIEPSTRRILDIFNPAYLYRYFELHPNEQQRFAQWYPIVAAVRIGENVNDVTPWLIDQIHKGLEL
jgi:aminoglycoside phosphotransferase (APT) family kinase protein